jgi:hypothetical protein
VVALPAAAEPLLEAKAEALLAYRPLVVTLPVAVQPEAVPSLEAVEQVKELELVPHELLKCPAFQAPSLTIFRFFRSYSRPFLHEIPSHCQNLFVVALAAPSAFWTVQIFSKTPPDLDLPIADIHQKLIEAQPVVVEAELFAGDQLLVVADTG